MTTESITLSFKFLKLKTFSELESTDWKCLSPLPHKAGAGTPAVVESCITWNGSLMCCLGFVSLCKGQSSGRCNENSTNKAEPGPWEVSVKGPAQAWSGMETIGGPALLLYNVSYKGRRETFGMQLRPFCPVFALRHVGWWCCPRAESARPRARVPRRPDALMPGASQAD